MMTATKPRLTRAQQLKAQFIERHPDLWKFIEAEGMKKGYGFFADMLYNVNSAGCLTERQLSTCERIYAERQEQDKARAAQTAEVEAQGPMAFPTLAKLLAGAIANGRKLPVLHLQIEGERKVKLSVAGPNSRYRGQIMLTDGGPFGNNAWYGSMNPETGVVTFGRSVMPADALETMKKYDADPLGYSKIRSEAEKSAGRIGICMCCGATLTNELSIELGIGPICRGKWGF